MRTPAVPPAFVLGLAAVVALALAACGGGGAAAPPPRAGVRPITVTTVTVAMRPLSYLVRGIGTLEAYQVVTVPARVEGVVEGLAFEEGKDVSPDRPLAGVDRERHALEVAVSQATVAKLTATLARADAQIASAQASLDEAVASLARREQIVASKPGVVSEEEIEGYRAQVSRFRAALAVAGAEKVEAAAGVKEAEARLALAERLQADAEVRPPIAGRVERKHVSEGQHVRAGDPVATIVDVRILRLRFRVTTPESVRLAKDQAVSFRSPGVAGGTFRATIVHVSEAADPATRMVECLAEVASPDPALKPGFFANVEVETGGDARAIVVPEDAILPTESGIVAFVVEDGVARRRAPTLGLRTSDGGVEVLSGLAVGEALVVRGANALEEGVRVTVVPAAAPGPGKRPSAGTPPPPPDAGPSAMTGTEPPK